MCKNFSVMTFNIRIPGDFAPFSWEQRRDSVIHIIKSHVPDIVGFQEVKESTYEFFIDNLRQDYDYYGVCSNPGNEIGQINPVFVRKDKYSIVKSKSFMLSPTPDIPASKGWDAAFERICSCVHIAEKNSETPFMYVYNTHLDYAVQTARKEELNVILDYLEEECAAQPLPFVIMGDFNDYPSSPAFYELKKIAQSCYSVFSEDERNLLTFNGYSSDIEGEPIDYIFTGNSAEFLGCEIVREIIASDHFPVLAGIIIKS